MAAVDIDAHLKDLSLQIDRLKVLYEQYFIGLEKLPPSVPRKEAEKLLAYLAVQNIGNTGMRFRYLSLVRRWKTYAERWDKVLREIENGTFSNHRIRARKALLADAAKRAEPLKPAAEGEAATAEGEDPGEAVKVARPRAARPPAEVPGMSEGDLRALHQQYVTALRSVGDGRDIRYEGLLASLKKQVPEILKKNNCEKVSFSVAVKDGKVVLRATPRRTPADPASSG